MYSQPSTLQDALKVLEQSAPRVIAGGTDVYPALKNGQQPHAFLDVTRIAGFSEIIVTAAAVRFGAAVTWTDVVKADLPPAFDALKQAGRAVGSVQIQNAGTLVGNICNASPAADGVPPMLALDAVVEVQSAARGVRRLPLDLFIAGVRQTTLASDELVTALIVPMPPADMTAAFEKLGSRRYLVISIAMTAANVVFDASGYIAQARVAVGACSAVAQRLTDLETDLVGQSAESLTILPKHLAPLAPIDDVRGTGAYRLDAVAQQIRRTILGAVAI